MVMKNTKIKPTSWGLPLRVSLSLSKKHNRYTHVTNPRNKESTVTVQGIKPVHSLESLIKIIIRRKLTWLRCRLASPQSKQAAATPKRNTYNLTSAERCHLAPLFRVIKFRVNAFLGAPPSKVVFEAAECDVWLRYMCPRPCRAGTEIHQPASVGLVVLTINLILEPGVKLNRGCWTPGS